MKTEIRYPAANASQPVIIRLFKQRIWCRTCNKRSMTSIAWENNDSVNTVNTVQRVLGYCSHQFTSSYDYLLEHLAFDEFKGVDHTLHLFVLMRTSTRWFRFSEHAIKKQLFSTSKSFRQRLCKASKQYLWT